MYGLLGKSLSHSYSPLIHKLLAGYEYTLFEKAEGEVEEFLKNGDFRGINVTIPYKKTVMKYLDGLDASAFKIGSVNTVVRRDDGTLYGYNTDYDGFKNLVLYSKIPVKDKKVLVLGTGGASAAVSAVLRDLGAGEIIFVSRNGADNYGNIQRHYDADIAVNTTPVGMFPECFDSPLDLTDFKSLSAVFDIIYNPCNTKLLLQAETLGIPAFSGLRMLVYQAKKAAELFTGSEIRDEKCEQVIKEIEFRMKNIVLIGMPGCGKTTVGKLLADKLSREFLDSDNTVEEKTGMKIPDIINAHGEQTFRRFESAALRELCVLSGKVIATGGGAVTQEENLETLRLNSFVIFLNRDINALPTDNRPLSKAQGVGELYKKRLPLYRMFCDTEIAADGTPEEVCQRILKEIL
ncbi:MAG: AAA family ATPase [Ruminococcaceae bacterium]|nr:AAA family ATPase [Oscillospiraceae bacterium]